MKRRHVAGQAADHSQRRQSERVTAALADAQDRQLLRLGRPSAVLVIDDVAYDQAGAPVALTHRCATTQGYVYINEIR